MRTQTDADAQKEHAQKDQINTCAVHRRALAAERARARVSRGETKRGGSAR